MDIQQEKATEEHTTGFSLSSLDKMLAEAPEKKKLELNEYLLQMEWVSTVSKVESNTIQEIALNNLPWLIGSRIYFHLKSDYEKSVIESCLKSLFEHLHHHFKHVDVEAEIRVFPDENNKKRIPITPKDKYRAMVEQNPNLQKMVDQLKLKLDY